MELQAVETRRVLRYLEAVHTGDDAVARRIEMEEPELGGLTARWLSQSAERLMIRAAGADRARTPRAAAKVEQRIVADPVAGVSRLLVDAVDRWAACGGSAEEIARTALAYVMRVARVDGPGMTDLLARMRTQAESR